MADAAPTPRDGRAQEPVWLVRVALALFLVGFAGYLARQLWLVLHA